MLLNTLLKALDGIRTAFKCSKGCRARKVAAMCVCACVLPARPSSCPSPGVKVCRHNMAIRAAAWCDLRPSVRGIGRDGSVGWWRRFVATQRRASLCDCVSVSQTAATTRARDEACGWTGNTAVERHQKDRDDGRSWVRLSGGLPVHRAPVYRMDAQL